MKGEEVCIKTWEAVCKAVEYETDGTPIRVFEEHAFIFYEYSYGYQKKHDEDGRFMCGGDYFSDVYDIEPYIRDLYCKKIGIDCLSEYPTVLKESISNEKETFSNVNNSQQESHYESIYDDNSQQEFHYESIYDAPAPQTQSWGGNMMPVQDFGGGGIYGGGVNPLYSNMVM